MKTELGCVRNLKIRPEFEVLKPIFQDFKSKKISLLLLAFEFVVLGKLISQLAFIQRPTKDK
jgi:hypothetical protein